jgi:uncharacterized protein (DUF488 family)
MEIYTIGHSNRSLDEFQSLLKASGIAVLVDVRAFPGSRKWPHFNQEALIRSLRSIGVQTVWMGSELGGFRRNGEGLGESSPNRGWRSRGFRLYADAMLGERFQRAADRLIAIAAAGRTAIMCAEKDFRRCHRRLISDYLLSRGHRVRHIIGEEEIRDHSLTEFAVIDNGVLTYPEGPASEDPGLPFPD